MNLNLVAQKIRDRRVYVGMKQADLAEKLGWSRSNVARYESGEADLNMTTLEALASALGVSIAYFFGEEVFYPESESIEAYYRDLPPDKQSMIRAMVKAAHEEVKRAETTHGKKAE